MTTSVENLLQFIQASPTAFQATQNLRARCQEAGYTLLEEDQSWDLELGGKYVVCRNQSSVIAFHLSPDLLEHYHYQLVASHSDSPNFKVKENGELLVRDRYLKLNTEGYGGMILHTWLDRPLSLAGRVLVRKTDHIEERLLHMDEDLLLIPNVAIHLLRDTNTGYTFNKQIDLLPLFAQQGEKGALKAKVADELEVSPEEILAMDLSLYNRTPGSIWGASQEFYSSPQIDNLASAFTTLEGFLAADHASGVAMYACFDNEEVGSGTKQGALSTFLRDVIERIHAQLPLQADDLYQALARSYMISADNAHAVHPNYPELTDDNNCSYLNEGVVVKAHAGQQYTTDAVSLAILKELAQEVDVPLQYFANRSDKRGGSTLGNLALRQVSLNSIDIGLPQLAMHSSYETAGVRDVDRMIHLIQNFFSHEVTKKHDGRYLIK